jgi:hypothetical protein
MKTTNKKFRIMYTIIMITIQLAQSKSVIFTIKIKN